MALGNRDTASLGMLTGWDATELKKYELEDGTSFATVAQMLGVAANGVASELYTDPIWSSMVSYTDMLEVEYRVGSSNGMGRYTEYGTPDPKRAQTEGREGCKGSLPHPVAYPPVAAWRRQRHVQRTGF
jgi:hypothetical protein